MVKSFFINYVGLAWVLPYLEVYASEIGGVYASDILATESLQSLVDRIHYIIVVNYKKHLTSRFVPL